MTPEEIVEKAGTIGGVVMALYVGGSRVVGRLNRDSKRKDVEVPCADTKCAVCAKEVEMDSLAKQVKELSAKLEQVCEDVAFMRGCIETFLKLEVSRKQGT